MDAFNIDIVVFRSTRGMDQNKVPDFRADGGRYEGRWCRW